MLLGILFQFIVFILDFGAGISCCGNFSITVSVVCARTGVTIFCCGGGGAGAGGGMLGGGGGIFGGGGGGGGRLGPKTKVFKV